jgi:EAL and modified HD-GYP domain-containing signal transduction protein
MNASPVFLNLLANRQGKAAAIVVSGDVRDGSASPLEERMAALAQKLPCFYRGHHAALAEAGWQPLSETELLHTDAPYVASTGLAPEVRWIDGNWPFQPPASPSGAQSASRALALQLVQLVSNDAENHEIEGVLRNDPTLSYHLLKLVNSLGMGMGTGRKITSFNQAILILGRMQLRRWLNLMLFAAREGDVRSPMLLARVSVRARMLELLARETGQGKPAQEQAFMTGMFSLLGVLFGMPLEELLKPLNIGDAAQQALLHRHGELGELLCVVEEAERGDFDGVRRRLETLQLSPLEFNSIVTEATLWMLDVTAEAPKHG